MSAELPSRPGEGINWEVGQLVHIVARVRDFEAERARPNESRRIFTDRVAVAPLSKVGRKWAEVEGVYGRRFNMATGREDSRSGSMTLWVSPEALERNRVRTAKIAWLHEAFRRHPKLDALADSDLDRLGALLVELDLLAPEEVTR